MTNRRVPDLPMAVIGCKLSSVGLTAQLDRYRRLGVTALGVEERERAVVVSFGADLDLDLLRETVGVERVCCDFFALDYDESARRLSISVDDSGPADALRMLSSALRTDR